MVPAPEGFGKRQGTMRDGYRESTATAFLRPARNRENLTILTEALVRRVIVENGRATGVEIERDGKVQTIKSERDIVLSGGAYGSPQILMLSGIGDPEELKKHGIDVVHSLPGVGRHLHDHLATTIKLRTKNIRILRHLAEGFSARRVERAAICRGADGTVREQRL